MGSLQGLFDMLTVLGVAVGCVLVYFAFMGGASAPQQGALAALAVAVTVIPYCLSATNHRAHMRRRQTDAD